MRDYYKEFVDISLQQCREDDYLDPKKIRAHNIAMRKMKRLKRELQSNGVTDFCQKLLKHEDDRVRMNAAVLCLQLQFCKTEAVETLSHIAHSSTDNTLRFSAKMVLKGIDQT